MKFEFVIFALYVVAVVMEPELITKANKNKFIKTFRIFWKGHKTTNFIKCSTFSELLNCFLIYEMYICIIGNNKQSTCIYLYVYIMYATVSLKMFSFSEIEYS